MQQTTWKIDDGVLVHKHAMADPMAETSLNHLSCVRVWHIPQGGGNFRSQVSVGKISERCNHFPVPNDAWEGTLQL